MSNRLGSRNLTPIERASRLLRVMYICERCDRKYFIPMNRDGECSICEATPETITPEVIAAETTKIREGWNRHDWKRQPGAPQSWSVPESGADESNMSRHGPS